jgi:hypothetical protein
MLIPPDPNPTFAVGVRFGPEFGFEAPVLVVAEVVAWSAPDHGDAPGGDFRYRRGGRESLWRPVVMCAGQPTRLGDHPWAVVTDLAQIDSSLTWMLVSGEVLYHETEPTVFDDMAEYGRRWLHRKPAAWLDRDAVALFRRYARTVPSVPQHPRRWQQRFSDMGLCVTPVGS